jgi:hypothetical protein
MLILLSVLAGFAENSVLAEYSAEYTAESFGRNYLRLDTSTQCT